MPATATVVQRAHLATTAAVVLLVVADPLRGLRSGTEWETWLEGQQRLDRVMSRVAPALFVATGGTALAAAGVAARERRRTRVVCRLIATGCVGAAVAVTLKINEPVNDQLRHWQPTDAPAPGWRSARARWEHGHRVRRGLLSVAAVATVVGASTAG